MQLCAAHFAKPCQTSTHLNREDLPSWFLVQRGMRANASLTCCPQGQHRPQLLSPLFNLGKRRAEQSLHAGAGIAATLTKTTRT